MQQHIAEINKLVQQTVVEYINCFVLDNDAADYELYAEDVAYNVNALVQFNATKDVQQLHDSIMQQDTLVREFFISVLHYIEDNDLIDEGSFCCI